MKYTANKLIEDCGKVIEKELIGFVKKLYLIANNYVAPNFKEGENYSIECEGLTLRFSVFDDYEANESIFREYPLDSIIVTENEELVFLCDDEEYTYEDIGIEELAGICNVIEQQVNDIYNIKLV